MEEKLKAILDTIKNKLEPINAKLDEVFSPQGKKIFLGLVCVAIVGIIVIVGLSLTKKGQEDTINLDENLIESENVIDSDNMEDIEIEANETEMVSFAMEVTGRSNPFLPANEAYTDIRTHGLDIMAPPNTIASEDSMATKIVSTKVSGILYEPKNPSAILNIEGNDYLVRSGDNINGYKVISIGKELVTVKLGPNVYKAHVGEVITEGTVNYNIEDNLQNKFGGAKK